jgi:tRNA(Ile2)-agmatinylcytidine synthase
MAVFIGVDDTDSVHGMCTTFLVTEIIRELGFPVLLGYPKLVRLNPNIPWKTRGNGALALSIGGDPSTAFRIGDISGSPVYMSMNEANTDCDIASIKEHAYSVVDALSQLDDENTNPGLIVGRKRIDPALYIKAVRGLVEKEEALRYAKSADADVFEWKNGRGVIGAASALAWKAQKVTFEIICYRKGELIGTKREVNDGDVSKLNALYPTTFNNYDGETKHSCIYPASPCPVLFGIRGTDPSILPSAMCSVRSETRERWIIFETNQGTDDHIEALSGSPSLFHSYVITGRVTTAPSAVEGGHVFFGIATAEGIAIDCAVFEETKGLRTFARKLYPGDTITVWGAFKPSKRNVGSGVLNIEKFALIAAPPRLMKKGNPVCKNCGRKMESVGRAKGYRCRECRTKAMFPQIVTVESDLREGVYAATVSSRRHLSMPAELIGRDCFAMAGRDDACRQAGIGEPESAKQ